MDYHSLVFFTELSKKTWWKVTKNIILKEQWENQHQVSDLARGVLEPFGHLRLFRGAKALHEYGLYAKVIYIYLVRGYHTWANSSVIRQKWQISKQVFQENKARQILRFLEIWRALFLEIPVLRFDLLPYYRRYVRQNQSIFQKWWILFTSPFVINWSSPPFHSLSIFWRYINSAYSTTKFHITYVPILPYYQRIIASKWISTILHELNVLTLVRLFLLS